MVLPLVPAKAGTQRHWRVPAGFPLARERAGEVGPVNRPRGYSARAADGLWRWRLCGTVRQMAVIVRRRGNRYVAAHERRL